MLSCLLLVKVFHLTSLAEAFMILMKHHFIPHFALLGKVNDFTGTAYRVNGFNDFLSTCDSFPENSSSIIAPRNIFDIFHKSVVFID
jgi:hypothetical protein